MKLYGKSIFKLTVSLAFLIAVQLPAIGSSRQPDTGIIEQVSAVKAALKPDAPAPVFLAPDDAGKTLAAQPAVSGVEPSDSFARVETQKTTNDVAAVKSAFIVEQVAQETSAAESADPQTLLPGVLYDAEQNIYFGPNGKGLAYIGFDYDADQKLFYSSLNCWQKTFGYNDLYDTFAPLGAMIFDTRTVYFNFGGINWMVKLWKGQYGITSGAEVGIYTQSTFSTTHYQGVKEQDFLQMDLTVYRYGELYYTREPQMHWWLSGFIVGDISAPEELSIETNITFKNAEMADAFILALSTQQDTQDVDYTINDSTASLVW